jgi:hypothetical protein
MSLMSIPTPRTVLHGLQEFSLCANFTELSKWTNRSRFAACGLVGSSALILLIHGHLNWKLLIPALVGLPFVYTTLHLENALERRFPPSKARLS